VGTSRSCASPRTRPGRRRPHTPSQRAAHAAASRIDEDVDSADLSAVSGTPTFFINGRRHYGAYDIATLSAAVRAAGARAVVATG